MNTLTISPTVRALLIQSCAFLARNRDVPGVAFEPAPLPTSESDQDLILLVIEQALTSAKPGEHLDLTL